MLSLIFIALIILMIVIWMRSDVTKINQGKMQEIVETGNYDGKKMDEISVNAAVGRNTVVVQGEIKYKDGGKTVVVKYSSE